MYSNLVYRLTDFHVSFTLKLTFSKSTNRKFENRKIINIDHDHLIINILFWVEKAKDNNDIDVSSATYSSKGKLNANLLVAKALIAGRGDVRSLSFYLSCRKTGKAYS